MFSGRAGFKINKSASLENPRFVLGRGSQTVGRKPVSHKALGAAILKDGALEGRCCVVVWLASRL